MPLKPRCTLAQAILSCLRIQRISVLLFIHDACQFILTLFQTNELSHLFQSYDNATFILLFASI